MPLFGCVALTAITPLQLAGWPTVAALSLPVAATTMTPAPRAAVMACWKALEQLPPPPRLMLITSALRPGSAPELLPSRAA